MAMSSAALTGAALDAPATRRNLRLRWMLCAAAALLAIALAGFAAWLWTAHRDGVAAERAGARATATITAVQVQNLGSGRTGGRITFDFVDAEGVAHSGTSLLDQRVRRYTVGELVEVSYDHLRPTQVTVIGDGTDPAPLPWPVAAIPALVVAAIAVHAGRRLLHTAAVLRTNPWVVVPSRLLQVPIAAGSAHALTMIELHGAPDDATVLATAVSFRARPMSDLVGTTWVAGDDRRFYLAAPGGSPIVRAKRIRLTAKATDANTVHTPLHSRVIPDT
jgi:hypothetical protein